MFCIFSTYNWLINGVAVCQINLFWRGFNVSLGSIPLTNDGFSVSLFGKSLTSKLMINKRSMRSTLHKKRTDVDVVTSTSKMMLLNRESKRNSFPENPALTDVQNKAGQLQDVQFIYIEKNSLF